MTHTPSTSQYYSSGTSASTKAKPLVIPCGSFTLKVMSRESAEAMIPTKSCIVISITSPSRKPAVIRLSRHIKAILHLSFHDKEASAFYGVDIRWKNMFSLDRARMVVEFVEKWHARVQEIIVHCEAGISRSAAIAAAIAMRYIGADDAIYKWPRSPNQFVKRLVCEEWLEKDPFAFEKMKDKRTSPWDRPYNSYSTGSGSYQYGSGGHGRPAESWKDNDTRVTPSRSGSTVIYDDKGKPKVTVPVQTKPKDTHADLGAKASSSHVHISERARAVRDARKTELDKLKAAQRFIQGSGGFGNF